MACEICDSIPDFSSANGNDGSSLPEAAERLNDVREGSAREYMMSGQKDFSVMKVCPLCGTRYEYSYHYDFSPGYIEEITTLKKMR